MSMVGPASLAARVCGTTAYIECLRVDGCTIDAAWLISTQSSSSAQRSPIRAELSSATPVSNVRTVIGCRPWIAPRKWPDALDRVGKTSARRRAKDGSAKCDGRRGSQDLLAIGQRVAEDGSPKGRSELRVDLAPVLATPGEPRLRHEFRAGRAISQIGMPYIVRPRTAGAV